MSEFRLNPATKEWVIIAGERAARPEDFSGEETEGALERAETPAWKADCPFCPGNEHMTPRAVYRDPPLSREEASETTWRVRIVPNKFPALNSTRQTEGRDCGEFFRSIAGVGFHDVLIENPVHNRFTPVLSREELRRVLEAYRWRYLALREDPRVKIVTIFKNHGRTAGTSLIHPHSQIIATPIVPFFLRSDLGVAIRYYDDSGRCVYSDMTEQELDDGRRIVYQTEHFVAFCPFASKFPYEVWVLPRRASPSFGAITAPELDGLADVLGRVLGALWEGLDKPAFNYVVRTAPIPQENEDYYLWHLEIVPRITTTAGFELGSGIIINVTVPEENAALLRRVIEARAQRV
ncbi:MAG: galactose-1-phosphate uridylyltransferase [Nitrospinota bacterium]